MSRFFIISAGKTQALAMDIYFTTSATARSNCGSRWLL